MDAPCFAREFLAFFVVMLLLPMGVFGVVPVCREFGPCFFPYICSGIVGVVSMSIDGVVLR